VLLPAAWSTPVGPASDLRDSWRARLSSPSTSTPATTATATAATVAATTNTSSSNVAGEAVAVLDGAAAGGCSQSAASYQPWLAVDMRMSNRVVSLNIATQDGKRFVAPGGLFMS
jgi:hypothetical protein